MASALRQIEIIDLKISEALNKSVRDRGSAAQDILKVLRDFDEAVAVLIVSGDPDVEYDYKEVKPAFYKLGQGDDDEKKIFTFHRLLQQSTSHYTMDKSASIRLMLKYYKYLLTIRTILDSRFSLSVLTDLEKFPTYTDQVQKKYYEAIAQCIISSRSAKGSNPRRFYINSIRPFFADSQTYYEVTFSPISDHANKFDHLTAYTETEIKTRYATDLSLAYCNIATENGPIPITIIKEHKISIRQCEINNFAKIFGMQPNVRTSDVEYKAIMNYLTENSMSLLDVLQLPEIEYAKFRSTFHRCQQKIIPLLDKVRELLMNQRPGANVIRYLLIELNNSIVKKQYASSACDFLSDLHLSPACKPFDDMPFCTSLRGHNPQFIDLLENFDTTNHESELFAHYIKNNTEQHGIVYTNIKELSEWGNVDSLIEEYNKKLYHKHTDRKLIKDRNHVFIKKYEDDLKTIIKKLQSLTDTEDSCYNQMAKKWLSGTKKIDDPSKEEHLLKLFEKSRFALVHGPAGTGKSTFIGYVSDVFENSQKLFLTQTNSAKNNLKQRVTSPNSTFRTVHSQIHKTQQDCYDLLVIDESSTISNSDFREILEKITFSYLLVVGDEKQIGSIQFGNWFSFVQHFIPKQTIFELKKTYRTGDANLLSLWEDVWKFGSKEGIEEKLAKHDYCDSPTNILKDRLSDEIILCLNYDGPYGINNLNKTLQSQNKNREHKYGPISFKIGDPILFKDVKRFKPAVFNNLKAEIVAVDEISEHEFRFSAKIINHHISEFDALRSDLTPLGRDTVQFTVGFPASPDEDEINDVIPFQLAYAISIHKAQGLEYNSVKVVITDSNRDNITHDIFYTAISRSKKNLTIFWTPETEHIVFENFNNKKTQDGKTLSLLRERCHLETV